MSTVREGGVALPGDSRIRSASMHSAPKTLNNNARGLIIKNLGKYVESTNISKIGREDVRELKKYTMSKLCSIVKNGRLRRVKGAKNTWRTKIKPNKKTQFIKQMPSGIGDYPSSKEKPRGHEKPQGGFISGLTNSYAILTWSFGSAFFKMVPIHLIVSGMLFVIYALFSVCDIV